MFILFFYNEKFIKILHVFLKYINWNKIFIHYNKNKYKYIILKSIYNLINIIFLIFNYIFITYYRSLNIYSIHESVLSLSPKIYFCIRKNYNAKLVQHTSRFFQRLCDGLKMHQGHFIKARWIISDKKTNVWKNPCLWLRWRIVHLIWSAYHSFCRPANSTDVSPRCTPDYSPIPFHFPCTSTWRN